jgi:hypothetical protein
MVKLVHNDDSKSRVEERSRNAVDDRVGDSTDSLLFRCVRGLKEQCRLQQNSDGDDIEYLTPAD